MKEKKINLKTRNVFLALSGMTPQVITEAIWGLVVREKMEITEIHIVTTHAGRKKLIENKMTDRTNGPLAKLWSVWGLPEEKYPLFGEQQIHVPSVPGKIEDLIDSHENIAMEEEITRLIRDFTKDSSVRLVTSLTGGRKTMSAYMILGMSVFARKDDLLYHVLIDRPGGNPPENWWFPEWKNKNEANWIKMFEVPFPELRRTFEAIFPELLKTSSLTVAIRKYNQFQDKLTQQVKLVLDFTDRKNFLKVDGINLDLQAKELVWLALLAWKKTNTGGVISSSDTKGQLALSEEDLNFCRITYAFLKDSELGRGKPNEITEQSFWASIISRLRERLPEKIGIRAQLFVNESSKGGGNKSMRAEILIKKKNISIKGYPPKLKF